MLKYGALTAMLGLAGCANLFASPHVTLLAGPAVIPPPPPALRSCQKGDATPPPPPPKPRTTEQIAKWANDLDAKLLDAKQNLDDCHAKLQGLNKWVNKHR